MTTFNLRTDPGKGSKTEQVEERVRTLAIGSKSNPLPKLHIIYGKKESARVDVDFTPDNRGVKGSGTAGVMRGAQRGAF